MNKESGKIIWIGEITSGSTQAGKDWRKQDAVIEWGNKFKEKLCLTFFNDKVDQLSRLSVGDDVTVEYTATSRSWQGNDGSVKWFHNISGQKIDLNLDKGNEVYSPNSTSNDDDEGDGLPF